MSHFKAALPFIYFICAYSWKKVFPSATQALSSLWRRRTKALTSLLSCASVQGCICVSFKIFMKPFYLRLFLWNVFTSRLCKTHKSLRPKMRYKEAQNLRCQRNRKTPSQTTQGVKNQNKKPPKSWKQQASSTAGQQHTPGAAAGQQWCCHIQLGKTAKTAAKQPHHPHCHPQKCSITALDTPADFKSIHNTNTPAISSDSKPTSKLAP